MSIILEHGLKADAMDVVVGAAANYNDSHESLIESVLVHPHFSDKENRPFTNVAYGLKNAPNQLVVMLTKQKVSLVNLI